ncbi:hypothetical protein [Kribbella sp. CA-293567]|uniref:hypothetical protein n=1 Tax=Kribbella sp. CA-293567 TaxID=3002436 RepID=UPI0022DD2E0D|nr:hypothetical protein [Kribbella sp. CA-293567]WBQ06786.1 hypothetical protein OX958_08320 [Kribbella sp. CA-293567]
MRDDVGVRGLRGVLTPVGAVLVVVAGLWLAISPADSTVRLTSDATHGVTLRSMRPSGTGEIDPVLANAVDASLARRGVAVRTNNLALFLQDVAPALRPKQTQLFRNLKAVGMSVTYRRAEPWANYRGQPGTFRVSMRYVLHGSRLGQAATDVGYSYAFHRGRLWMTSDRALDQAIGSNRQPWDFGPIDVLRRVNVVVIVNRGQLPRARSLADETVASAKRVRAIWPGQLQTVPYVVALREPQVLTEIPPRQFGPEPIQVRAMLSPAIGSIQPAGGWVVIRRTTVTPAQLTHALMHLLPVRLGDGAPQWLAEGMAQYAGNQVLPAVERAKLRAALTKSERLQLTRLPNDDEFGAGAADAISWVAVEQLIARAGVRPVTEFYRQVARRGYNDAATERLMVEYTGLTSARLVESVRGSAG